MLITLRGLKVKLDFDIAYEESIAVFVIFLPYNRR